MRAFNILSCVCCLLMCHVATAAITLVQQHKSPYCIYYAPDAPSTTVQAVRELHEYVRKSTGAVLPIIASQTPPTCPFISLGENAATKAAGFNAKVLPLEGYRIVSKGKNIFIFGIDTKDGKKTKYGGTSAGTLNGVYTFLEEDIGVRWLMPGEIGEYVPVHASLEIPAIDRIDKPGFENRRIAYVQNENPLVKQWLQRQKQGYSLELNHGHSWVERIPADLYETHPDWFPMIGGIRPAPVGRYKLETTNKGLVEEFSKRVIAAFRKNPQLYSYSISPSDGENWSTSPESVSLYDKDPYGRLSLTRLVLDFYNSVAHLTGQAVPDRLVCGYIYSNYVYPPSDGIPRLEPNLCLVIAPSFSYGYGLYRQQARDDFEKVMRGWSEATGNIAYYDLPVMFEQTLGAPNPPGIEILKFVYPRVAKYGMKGIYIYGVNAWGHGGVTNYLLAKLNWNPYADVDALAKEYFLLSYGPKSGPIMAELYYLLDTATKKYYRVNPDARYVLNRKLMTGIYVPILPKLESLYNQALASTTDPKALERLRMFESNLIEFCNYLRREGLIADNRSSPFYARNTALVSIPSEKKKYDTSLALAPRPTRVSGTLDDLMVTTAGALMKDVWTVYPFALRGESRLLVYSPKDSEVSIKIMEMFTSDGDQPRYAVMSRDGKTVTSGELRRGDTIQFHALAESVYFVDIISNNARYKIQVNGGRFAVKSNVQPQGLHLYKELTPLYFYVPRDSGPFSVTLSTWRIDRSSTAADLYSPSGERVMSLDTSGSLADRKYVTAEKSKGGFWALVWKTPKTGAVDDIWVLLDPKLTPWIMTDPRNSMVIQPVHAPRKVLK